MRWNCGSHALATCGRRERPELGRARGLHRAQPLLQGHKHALALQAAQVAQVVAALCPACMHKARGSAGVAF